MPFPSPDSITGWVSQQTLGGLVAPEDDFLIRAREYAGGDESLAQQLAAAWRGAAGQQPAAGAVPLNDMTTGGLPSYLDPTGYRQPTDDWTVRTGDGNFTTAPYNPNQGLFVGMPSGGNTLVTTDPNQVNEYEHDARTRSNQAALRIAALIAGGSALSNLGTAPASQTGTAGTAGGGATTYPYVAGGTVTGAPLTGSAAVTGANAAAGAAGGIVPGAGGAAGGGFSGGAAAGAAAGGNFLQNWLPHITTGVNTLLGYRAADQAADTESAALQSAIDEQRRQFDLSREDAMPWLTAGQGALGRLQDPTAFTASPGYEFTRNEGQRDIGNSFAARGGAASGNALRALSEYNQGLASNEYNNWWNQQSGLAGLGQNTQVNLGNLGGQSAGKVGNYLADQGVSRASGVLGKYGALAGGLNEGVSNWLYQRRRRPN